MKIGYSLLMLGIAFAGLRAARSEEASSPLTSDALADLERRGALIGSIEVHVDDVFDLGNPAENKKLYRAANKFHIETREGVVRDVLLFRSGDHFSRQVLEESERLLRRRSYIADATIRATHYDATANRVDVSVETRDAWSFRPQLNFGRSGGENHSSIGVAEANVLGFGKSLKVSYKKDVDRDETLLHYTDPNVRGGRVRLDFLTSDNSDGRRQYLSVGRPFFALDSRWAVSSEVIDDKRIDSIYDLGEVVDEFRHDNRYLNVFGGWSRGLVQHETRRWLAGLTFDQHRFVPTADVPVPQLLPDDRKLVYPWIGFEFLKDDFRRMSNLNTIGRVEDIGFGLETSLSLGRSSESFGADRDAWILSGSMRKGWELPTGSLLFVDAAAHARSEDAGIANGTLRIAARYFRRNFERHLFSIGITTVLTDHLDGDRQLVLGGETGLRGYPLRYQTGRRSTVVSLEERIFTDLYPWHLFRIAGAVFLDAGRVWGRDPRATPSLGMLYDIGVGLRLASPRSSRGSVVHIDLAFPVNGDPAIDGAQLSVETKATF